jgi:hypothetical protein
MTRSVQLFSRIALVSCLVFVVALVIDDRPSGAQCEVCNVHWYALNSYCQPVLQDGSVGVTNCTTVFDVFSGHWDCFEGGNACSVINAKPGGGGGGGTGDPCAGGAAGCPAECFSCGGQKKN